jgi:hypothetical protein
MGCFYLFSNNEFRFFFPKLTINVMGKGRGNKQTWRAQKNKNLLIFFQLDNNVGVKIYFMGEVSSLNPK